MIEEIIEEEECDCLKILIADDDQFNIIMLRNLLKSFGLDADFAVNGELAVEQFIKKS